MTKVLHILSYNKLAAALVFVLMFVCYGNMSGQVKNVIPQGKPSNILHYRVIDGDTVFVETLRASKCYSRLPRQKGKEWRKYYRLVNNFARTYPYALASKKILLKVDSTIIAEGMRRGKRDKYINQMQKDLFKVFEEMKLIIMD